MFYLSKNPEKVHHGSFLSSTPVSNIDNNKKCVLSNKLAYNNYF